MSLSELKLGPEEGIVIAFVPDFNKPTKEKEKGEEQEVVAAQE